MTAFLFAAGAETARGQEPVPGQQSYTAAQDEQMSRPGEIAAAPVYTDPSCAWIGRENDFNQLWEKVKLRDIWPGSPCKLIAADRLKEVLEKKPPEERLKTYVWLYNLFLGAGEPDHALRMIVGGWERVIKELKGPNLHQALDYMIDATPDFSSLNEAARAVRNKNPEWESNEEFMLRTAMETLSESKDAQSRHDAAESYLLAATTLSPYRRHSTYQALMTKLTEEEIAAFMDKIFEAEDSLPFLERISFLVTLEGYARKDSEFFKRLLEKRYEAIVKDAPDRFVQAYMFADMFLNRGKHLDKNMKQKIVDEIIQRIPDIGGSKRLETGLKIAMCEDCAPDARRKAAIFWGEEIKRQEDSGDYELVDTHLIEYSRTDGPLREIAVAIRFDNIEQASVFEKEETICLLALNYLKPDNPRVPAAFERLMNILRKEPDPYERTVKILNWLAEAERESNLEKTLIGEWAAHIPLLSYEERVRALKSAEEWRGRAISAAAQKIMIREQGGSPFYIP